MKAIADIVNEDAAAKDKAFADGLYVAKSRYVMARAEGRSIYARQVGAIPSRREQSSAHSLKRLLWGMNKS